MVDRLKCALLFLPAIFATAAFFLSVGGNILCSTIEFHPTTTTSNNNAPVVRLGVFYYQSVSLLDGSPSRTHPTCSSYPSSTNFDGKWKTAKAFSIIAPVIGGFCLFWTWAAPCCIPNERQWRRGGVLYLLCGVFAGLTMIFLASNACRDNPATTIVGSSINSSYGHECELGPGSKMNIVSIILWLAVGIGLLVVPAPSPYPTPPVETQTVTYQRTTLPDGTVAVTETNIIRGTVVPPPNDNKVLKEIEGV